MIFQFKIQLEEITKPPVWRRVQVNADITFRQFHDVIQTAFLWSSSHLYFFSEKGYQSSFHIQEIDHFDYDGDGSDDAEKIKLKDIFKKEKQNYRYIYDFGDDWDHKITLEKILDGNLDLPICLAGNGQCPPEDCGGIGGFAVFKEAINNPSHPEYEELRELLGFDEEDFWDENEFNIEEVNELLQDFE